MLIGIADLQKTKDKDTRPPTRQSALMKNIARQPGAHGKEEEVKTGPLCNRGAAKQPATAGGKSTFARHRNTNSITGAAALGGVSSVNKSMDLKQPGLAKANSHLKEPGSALSKRSSLSG